MTTNQIRRSHAQKSALIRQHQQDPAQVDSTQKDLTQRDHPVSRNEPQVKAKAAVRKK